MGALLVRLTPTERQRLLVLTIVSGGLCGLAAVTFHVGIDAAQALYEWNYSRQLIAVRALQTGEAGARIATLLSGI